MGNQGQESGAKDHPTAGRARHPPSTDPTRHVASTAGHRPDPTGGAGRSTDPILNVAWTGHRPEFFADPAAVERHIRDLATTYQADLGARLAFHCGGQRGVDTWAGAAAEALGIALHLYLPLPIARFAADWPSPDVATLERHWAYAVERVVLDPGGTLGAEAYSRRNGLLAERGDVLIAVWTGLGGGGTAETIAFARSLGRYVEEHHFPASDRVPRPGERGV